ncbi:MAG: hypothetical protein JSU07_08125 [Bacteroidetes bacterium]|nr:hypothetical protein [Bacteroidota bacterium]
MQSQTLTPDSAETPPVRKYDTKHIRRATIMSAALPGLGQIYNKKYFKPVIIYTLFGGLGYFFYTNNQEYQFYRSIVRIKSGLDPGPDLYPQYDINQVQLLKLQYKKYRDMSAVGIGLVYLLNIIDANVDGHLKTFDVSDNLTMRWEPTAIFTNGGNVAYALNFNITIKTKTKKCFKNPF